MRVGRVGFGVKGQNGTATMRARSLRHIPQERHMETYDPNKNTTEVRQARPRKMNLRVLATSMIGVIVLFVIIFVVYSMMQPAAT